MRRVFCLLLILTLMAMPVLAEEYTAPLPPEDAEALMPAQSESFASDLWQIIRSAVSGVLPEVTQGVGVCVSLLAVMLMISVLQSASEKLSQVLELVGAVAIGGILLTSAGSMISLGAETVTELSEYGKLLLPVMTGALAAQGGSTSSAALYAITVVFDSILSGAVGKLLVPMVYTFLALSIAGSATGEESLKKLGDFVKWLMSWFLKIMLYAFTGFMGITGVVSGTADAAAVKATKLTISGMVPVVGGIISDASEAVIVGAGVVKSAVGVYGLLAVIAIWIAPFLQIGLQYLLLKATAALSDAFGIKRCSDLIHRFAAAMGLLLAMTGTVCFLLLISTVCFMKGGL